MESASSRVFDGEGRYPEGGVSPLVDPGRCYAIRGQPIEVVEGRNPMFRLDQEISWYRNAFFPAVPGLPDA